MVEKDKLRKVKRIAGWSTFILLIVTQWGVRPWALFAGVFIAAALTWQSLDCYFSWRAWKILILAGGSLNSIAVIANGGRMPVLGRAETWRWWEPLTEESRLIFLCDIYAKSSIGDMLILAALLIAVASWFHGRYKAPAIALSSQAGD